MSDTQPPPDALRGYHRRRPPFAGKSVAEISRQWGRADILSGVPASGVPAGSYQTVTIRITVGSMGIDEDGGVKLAFRFVTDMGNPQTERPSADDYVTARTDGPADIDVQIERKATIRPFQRTIFLHCRKATLHEGHTIDITLGDSTGGSKGWRQQTFVETPFPIRVSVDPLGTHDYQELPRDLGWNIVPGPAARFVAIAPSFAAAGDPFAVRVKAEDAWGNPLRDLSDERPRILIVQDGNETPVPSHGRHDRGVWRFPITRDEQGTFRFRVAGDVPTVGNGVTVRAADDLPPLTPYWCDLHGQTGETVGSGTIEDYFRFGRHYGFLDGSVHQGNDFQIGLDTWEHIKHVTNRAYEPGAFVTFQGYEWSGTHAMGGDHNVLYHEQDPPIYRSSGWLDGNPFEEHAPLPKLYDALRGHNALTIAHVGGRPASLITSDPDIEPLMEIHSAWGTFEWVYQEAFERGYKIGFVSNSDGHKCRPGASYPGAGIFGTLGGLTCVLSETHDRDGFWHALRNRRCYGTTGQRISIDADLDGHPIGSDVTARRATINARILGTSPIDRLDLMKGSEVIRTVTPASEGAPQTVVIRFGGARVKGRARMVTWRGTITVRDNDVRRADMNGVHSPIHGLERTSADRFSLHCVTTGNLVNVELELENGPQGTLVFESEQTTFTIDLADLNRRPRTLFTAPLDQRVEAFIVDKTLLPLRLEASFAIDIDHKTAEPYFLRVVQLDEGRAWTSPFYVQAP